MSILVGFWRRIAEKLALLSNNKPVYVLTENGITHTYKNFNKTEDLPFDTDTYNNCHLFIKGYANPWRIDIHKALNEYEEIDFTKHSVNDILTEEHIIPSQKYKQYMNQGVLTDIFMGDIINIKKIMWLLYGVIILVIIFGILGILT